MKRLSYILVTLVIASCANRGIGPQGGPKDETPPVITKEEPENGSVNYHDKTVTIHFNEYVQLDKVSENVLVSPPQQKPPEVKAVGKHVTVKFDEDLKDSTTYTIDFGSAICDLNEKNPMKDYSFAFSTGPEIDSLQIGGLMLNAKDLNPISKIVVGIHKNLSDSIIEKEPFVRIAKTNEQGRFLIKNIHGGNYRLYGLNDMSSDFLYQPGEGIAIYDSIVTPTCFRDLKTDTVYKDTIITKISEGEKLRDTLSVIDTIITKERTFYKPDSLVLIYFDEDKTRQYFIRALREQQHFITLLFNAPQDSMPVISAVGLDILTADTVVADSLETDTLPIGKGWMRHSLLQVNEGKDTIVIWLTDSSVIKMDTLEFEMRYFKTDSVYQPKLQIDTIRALYRPPRNAGKTNNAPANEELAIKSNASNSFDFFNTLRLTVPTPLKSYCKDSMRLYQMEDTLKHPIPFNIAKGDSAGLTLNIEYKWEPQNEYMLQIDSAALTDIYNKSNNRMSVKLKTKSLEEYSTLTIKFNPVVENAVVQILSDKDEVVREMRAEEGTTRFEYLKPESFYVRMYIDLNGDGKWTTGDFMEKRQPEPVRYYPAKLTLRANWEFEEEWDIYALPVERCKPDTLKKDANAKK